MITLPEQPWEKGDDFTVEETGVRYVYDGEKWLSESGEEADLSGFATKGQLDALAEESALTDNSLYKEIDQTSKTLTAAIAVVESDVQREKNNRIKADEELQEQIDSIEFPETDLSDYITTDESKADDRQLQAEIDQLALGLETLLQQREAGKWTYKGALADGSPRNAGEFVLASDDLSASDTSSFSIRLILTISFMALAM